MAAPTPTARVTPPGRRIGDGFGTVITFAADTNVDFWEESVTPVGMDGGDPIVTKTMHNTAYVTKHPRRLKEITNGKATVAYDPIVLSQIPSLINNDTTITETYPNGDTYCYYGYLKSFMPGEWTDGEEPTAEIEWVVTNFDPVNCVEAAPVYTAGSGTACY